MKLSDYTPKIINSDNSSSVYVEMLVESKKCPLCSKQMVMRDSRYGIFPIWMQINQDAQVKRGGLVYFSRIEVDGNLICQECSDAGRASFKCELCHQRHNTSEIQERIGRYLADYLCKLCYSTVSAQKWAEKIKELEEEHKYDY
jgi:ssDNA-binding Zn-finger/Zn-ribbon topoisomerase 1